MSELRKKENFGDITFGVPRDIKILEKPYGFYKFLGVRRNASVAKIKVAYKEKSKEFHPDKKGGDEEKMKALGRVYEILSDDGGEFGAEHSRRVHYDRVSSLDSFFDGFLEHEDERTKKLSEILLANMEGRRNSKEEEVELEREEPQFFGKLKKLEERLEEASNPYTQKKVLEELLDLKFEHDGIDENAREEILESLKERAQDHRERKEAFMKSFAQNMGSYASKIIDIFYVGNETVTFAQFARSVQFGLAAYKEGKDILTLILFSKCNLKGLRKVHYKAEEGIVRITDPNLTGIVHVVEGRVDVDYKAANYGDVIRARAPNVMNISGFEQHGNLYIAKRFAVDKWWEKKPELDIAVHDGAITLNLQAQTIARSSGGFYDSYITKNYDNINDILFDQDMYKY